MSDIKIPEEISAMPFEKAIAELETLVAKMENGGQNLEDLMNCFERGRYLTEHCRSQLSTLERKIAILTNDDGQDGRWDDFDASSGRRMDDPPF